ncbi:MAG: aspartyl protease [Acidobacteria bacterium]|nr:MAG: aspartyl protease [Acidobacteriota bacterium]
MGLTFVSGEVTGPAGNHMIVEFMVDSGAEYTVLPHDVWNAIALLPKRRERFVLADGTHVERDVSECHISLPQGEAHTPVILGQPGDDALLGVVTLQILGFVLNPFNRTLQPARLRM